MVGATAQLYISSDPNYDGTLSTATDTGIKLNFSLCVSPYTQAQVIGALSDNLYFFDDDAVLNSTTAALLDKYSPGWNNIFEIGSAASNYVGSVENAAPDKTMRFFPSVYSQNIYETLAQYSGGRAYIVFNKNNILSFYITDGNSFIGQITPNGENSSFQPKITIKTYGAYASYNTAWGDGTDYPWQFNGGWIIKCKDGYVKTIISEYDTKKASCRISADDIWSSRDIEFLNSVFLSGWKPFIPDTDTDPYIKGDEKGGGSGGSGTGGGTGDFNGTTEDVNIPNLPTLSAVDTGLISLFNPSSAQLKTLANYLWGDVFDISTWKKIFADPMDAILGLSIVPVNVPSSGSASLTIGNISTGITLPKVSSQYVTVDCGTINVNEYWGAYLDYSPYTQAEIYLPFIGIHPMTIDDIMGKPVHVVYHIDVLSGACCAYIKCGGSVLYSFVGQCSCSIPITANDWTNVINGTISIAASIGTMVATGGASAPMAIPGMAATATNSLKPAVEKSGAMGGMGGMLAVQNPYIILTRPKQAIPAYQNTFTGYPSFITKALSECSGYTEVESIHLENVPATDGELQEINDLLKSGVII